MNRIVIRSILFIRCYMSVPALYETGGHHDLYSYLTRMMGLFVQAGRGPAGRKRKSRPKTAGFATKGSPAGAIHGKWEIPVESLLA